MYILIVGIVRHAPVPSHLHFFLSNFILHIYYIHIYTMCNQIVILSRYLMSNVLGL